MDNNPQNLTADHGKEHDDLMETWDRVKAVKEHDPVVYVLSPGQFVPALVFRVNNRNNGDLSLTYMQPARLGRGPWGQTKSSQYSDSHEVGTWHFSD